MKEPPPTLPPPRPPHLSALTISSFSSSSSSPFIVNRPVCLKKTRFVPDLSVCHCCGLRFPSPSLSGGALHLLRSQWRIALLCPACLPRISSAELCSYCFTAFSSETPNQALDCLACLRRAHLACIRREHYRLPPAASKAAFTCIDCCFIPKNANSGSAKSHDAQPALSEDEVRDARADAEKKAAAAAKAQKNALAKAEAAKLATERAQKALEAVLVAGKDIAKRNHLDSPPPPVVRDEDFALRLHLAMNGSRRISRSAKTGSLVKPKKIIGDQMLGKVQFCTEDKSFFDSLQAELNADTNELKRAIDDIGKDGILRAPLKEEQCYSGREKTLNSDLDEPKAKLLSVYHKRRKNMDDVISLQQCAKDIGGVSTTLQEKNTTASDRYMNK